MVERVEQAARSLFDDTFVRARTVWDGQFVRLTSEPEGGPWRAALDVYSFGLIELLWQVDEAPGVGHRLALLDVLDPLHRLTRGVEAGLLRELFPGGRPRRSDWSFALSPSALTSPTRVEREGFVFPCEAPPQVADAVFVMPPAGLGDHRLRDVPVRASHRIEPIVAAEVLLRAGYRDVEDVVTYAIDELRREREQAMRP